MQLSRSVGRSNRSNRSARSTRFLLCLVLVSFVALSGCSMLRTLLPGGPTLADIEFHGVKSGEPISVIGTLDPRAEVAAGVLSLLGQSDPFGVVMPVLLVGQDQPRYILCTEEWVSKCKAIPLNSQVHFAGQPVGSGLLWKPSRLTASGFDD